MKAADGIAGLGGMILQKTAFFTEQFQLIDFCELTPCCEMPAYPISCISWFDRVCFL
jgi:hypothetical protein